jgi:dTDP-4-amino-4,6-dideoxygalactose transaminase
MIPFNKPYATSIEFEYIRDAYNRGHFSGDGHFTKQCHRLLQDLTLTPMALLTHSCTAALEMSAMLLDIKPGDEVIMPSFTFTSTANAFVMRGAVPVFVDIRPDTLNINETLVEGAVTKRTRVILPVHYAGVACDMDSIMQIANHYSLHVVEDAAQAIMSKFDGKTLGTFGDLGALSFHETKNITCGEGGALLVNNKRLLARAEIVWEKGTDRSRFHRGEVDKYTWQELGSSMLPGELTAAFLMGQLTHVDEIIKRRLDSWSWYHQALLGLEERGLLRRPIVPANCVSNGHIYYVLLNKGTSRDGVLKTLKECGVDAVSHYVPLHTAPAGVRFGRASGLMNVTDATSNSLIRLPLWVGISQADQEQVINILESAIKLNQLAANRLP